MKFHAAAVASVLVFVTESDAKAMRGERDSQLNVGAAPAFPPAWPAAFNISFNEVTNNGQGNTTLNGTWYYDYSNGLARMDRSNGNFDRFCRSTQYGGAQSQCTHLNVPGYRYLIWPHVGSGECCMCCTDSFGCGVTKPNWVQLVNGTYIGKATFDTPSYAGQADSWEATGLQTNYYYQTDTAWGQTGVPAPVALVQGSDDYQFFEPSTFSVGPQPSGLFDLPAYCDVNNLCDGFCKYGMMDN